MIYFSFRYDSSTNLVKCISMCVTGQESEGYTYLTGGNYHETGYFPLSKSITIFGTE